MNPAEAFEKVIKIVSPHAKNQAALASATGETNILEDLEVNSARLVDVVLAFEDEFDIEIADDELDSVITIGDCVKLIVAKTG
jgi:acyl carrier protein